MGQREEDMLRKNVYLMQQQIQEAYKRIDSLVEENRKLKKISTQTNLLGIVG